MNEASQLFCHGDGYVEVVFHGVWGTALGKRPLYFTDETRA